MQEMLSPEEVVGIAAFQPTKVRQHQADGSVQEWMEQPAPDTKQLTQQLAQIMAQSGQQLCGQRPSG